MASEIQNAPAPSLSPENRRAQPYKGPCPFEEKDHDIFFGRDREVDDLVSLVLAHSEVLLYAQSGAGKSSLIRAGLLPILRGPERCEVLLSRVQGERAEIAPVDEKDFNPYVFHVLCTWEQMDAAALQVEQPDPKASARLAQLQRMTLRDYLRERPAPTDEDELALPRVLIFDQFEELFTAYPQYWRQRRGFFAQVRDALAGNPELHVLFAMREEYLASLEPFRSLLPEKLGTRYRLQRMRPAAAKAAIERPLSVRDKTRRFADGVVDAIVKDLLEVEVDTPYGPQKITEDSIEPVQLSVVCQNLWSGLGSGATEITAASVYKTGGVQRALRRFYEDALRVVIAKTKADEKAVRLWFEEKLITPGGTRSTVFAEEKAVAGLPVPVVQSLQDLYLVRGEQRARGSWYELTHDRLIGPIRASNRDYIEQNALAIWFHRHWRQMLSIGVPILICAFLFGGWLIWDWHVANRDARRRTVELNVSHGLRLLEADNPPEALLFFTKALNNDDRPLQLATHQARIGTVLGQFPRLVDCWFRGPDESVSEQQLDADPYYVDKGRFSKDGRLAVVILNRAKEKNARVRIYATDGTGGPVHEFLMRENRQVNSARFSPDGAWVVTASTSPKEDEGEVQVWRIQGEESETPTSEPAYECSVAQEGATHADFHPLSGDGRVLFVGAKGAVGLWRPTEKLPKLLERHPARVNYAEFSPDKGELFITASGTPGANGEVRVYDSASGFRRWSKVHPGAVNHAAFSPDGRHFVTASEAAGGETGQVQLWNVEQLQTSGGTHDTPQKHDGAVLHAAFSPDGRHVISTSRDSTAVVWKLEKGATKYALQRRHVLKHGSHVNYAAFSPDGRLVVTACRDTVARFWNVATGALALPPVNHTGTVGTAEFSPDGRFALTAGGFSANYWDLWPGFANTSQAAQAPFATLLFTDGWRNQTPNSLAGRYVVSAWRSPDQQARVWDAMAEKFVGRAFPVPFEITVAAVSPDGKFAVVGSSQAGAVQVWQLAADQEPRLLIDWVAKVHHAAFSGKGHLALAMEKADDKKTRKGKILILEMKNFVAGGFGPTKEAEFDDVVTQVGFSRKADLIAAVTQTKVHLLETASAKRRPFAPLAHREEILSVRFSDDDRLIVTASVHDDALVWSAHDGAKLSAQALKHSADVLYAALSPDGQTAVTASFDGTAAIWDWKTSQRQATLMHGKPVTYAAFSGDGRRLLTASEDATVKVWDIGPWSSRAGESAGLTKLIATLRHSGPVQFADFVNGEPDRIVSVGYGMAEVNEAAPWRHVQSRIWNIAPDRRAREIADSHVALLSGRKLEGESDQLKLLAPGELHKAWRGYAGTAPAAVVTDASSARAWHDRQARQCEKLGQWFAAAWHLERQIPHVLASKDLAELHDRRGRAFLALRLPEPAVADFNKAVATDPANWQFWNHRARAYKLWADQAMKHFGELKVLSHKDKANSYLKSASNDYKEAQSRRKSDWRLWQAHAEILAALDLHGDAIASFKAARNLNKQSTTILVGLASSHEKLDLWDEAIGDYDQAVKLTPNDWRLYRRRAMAYAVKAMLAVERAKKATQREQTRNKQTGERPILGAENDPRTTLNLEELWTRVADNYHEAIKRQPEAMSDKVELMVAKAKARVHLSEVDAEEIAGAYTEVVELQASPWHHPPVGAWYLKGSALGREINLFEELADLRHRSLLLRCPGLVLNLSAPAPMIGIAPAWQLARTSEAAAQDYLQAAQAHEKKFGPSTALEGYANAIALNPANPAFRAARAAAFGRLHRWSDAAADYARAAASQRDNPKLLTDCALAHAHAYRWDDAIGYFTRAFAIDDAPQAKDPIVLSACAYAHVMRGKWDDAIRYYEQAMALDKPGANVSARLQCASAYAERALARWEERLADAQALDVPFIPRSPAELGDFHKAADLLQHLIDGNPLYRKNAHVHLRLAVIRLAAGNRADYQRTCAKMLEEFGATGDALTANNVAWACALGPKAIASPNRAVDLARLAVQKGPESRANYLNTLGAALHRAGRFTEAADVLRESRKAHASQHPGTGDQGTVWDKLFMAFTIHGMGHPEIARVWLDWAKSAGSQAPRYPGDTFDEPPAWQLAFERLLLRQELEQQLPRKKR